MAAHCRSPLLLLLLPFVCSLRFPSVLSSKAVSGPAEPPNPPAARAAEPPVRDAPAAGASPPRRTAGWRLAEEEACREDLLRLCPKHTWTNNLAVLECLQDRREDTDIAPDCNHFESVATEVCKSTISEIKECSQEERGRGYLLSCLVDHRGNISEYQCNQYVTKMTSIVFSDYRLICGFTDKCKEDINSLRCGSVNVGHKDVHSQGEVIACLEKALVREAEQQDPVRPIREECQKAILRVAELSSDDFHLDRHLYFACRDDRERFCQNTQAGEGKVYKCLFNHKFEESMSEKDYRVSYSLAKACRADLRKQRCSLDSSLPRAREARLSYLLLCLEAAVHRGRPVSGECQGEMLDYRRMLMEDFSLSPEIVLHCRAEIEAQCSGLHRKGRTLHCLMRAGRGDRSATVDSVCQSALQTLVQSADPGADYRIDRALNEACEILSCLMEHLYTEKMVEDCEHRLLELQYFISRDWKLDPTLYRKCQGDAARLCHTHGWNETSELMPPGALSRDCKVEVQRILHQRALDVKLDPELQRRCLTDLGKWCSDKTDTGQELECLQEHLEDLVSGCKDVVGNLTELESEDIQIDALLIRAYLMECLVQNKHQKEMNDKCTVGVTHFQLIQMKDFRFSYKFKLACKEDVLRLCPNIKKKVDVVICLSTTVRNDTLQEVREQRVSLKCRKQLRVEELEMSEDIRLEPELFDPCKSDISRLCPNVAFGNAQRFCTEADARNVLQCLKQNKNSELMDPKCKQTITKRQITQNTGGRTTSSSCSSFSSSSSSSSSCSSFSSSSSS
ncbi:unnamed protein product [Menidia menidia]|uniref:Golgi apparatus protein 1 n=1 Tax=Menidia menidia TaxID=238744 RepID=A0A8S4A523_9TELE|nr:unnamed protein product [Menidia menidia]